MMAGLHALIACRRWLDVGAGTVEGGMDMSSMIEKEREEMRAKFLQQAEEERQRIREELQAKLRMELEESVRAPVRQWTTWIESVDVACLLFNPVFDTLMRGCSSLRFVFASWVRAICAFCMARVARRRRVCSCGDEVLMWNCDQPQKSWDERLRETDQRQKQREGELRTMGVLTGEERQAQIEKAKAVAHIVNLHEDPSLSRQLIYFFDEGACGFFSLAGRCRLFKWQWQWQWQ